jgi:HSP20 family protein
MNLLKRWRGHHRDNGGNALVKHQGDHRGLVKGGDFRDFRKEIDRVFDRVWRDFDRDPWSALTSLPEQFGSVSNWPAVDVAEDENAVTLRVDVPGLDEKDLDVEVSGNLLTIRGSREDEWSGKKHGVRRRERVSGSFARTITLPSYVDSAKVEAKYEKGTLTVTVPKIPGHGPRRVQVTSG